MIDYITVKNRKELLLILVAPDVLHRHVKSLTDPSAKNLHFQAPEIDEGEFEKMNERKIYEFYSLLKN